jgi:UDP-2,4-diacetamido-2,4,6-trideoxy-beta-L-altropyranose hydrolase
MIVFRTTAGKQIGFGHLRRCLNLAAALRTSSGGGRQSIAFWIDGDPAAVAAAEADGFEARRIAGAEPETTAAWLRREGAVVLIADSYDILPETFSAWRPLADRLVVLDDLADRFLDVDVVLNGSPHAANLPYRTSAGTTLLLGPAYALLRPGFRDRPPHAVADLPSRVLVTLGGADPQGSTQAVVAAVERALAGAFMDIVVGPLFGPTPKLDLMVARDSARLRLHRQLDDLSALMTTADLAVSGGGQTLYELAASGVPTVALCLADNQQPNIAALANVSLLSAGPLAAAAASGFQIVEEACRQLAADRALRARLSRAGQGLIDGRGAVRAADVVLKMGRRPGPVDHGQS